MLDPSLLTTPQNHLELLFEPRPAALRQALAATDRSGLSSEVLALRRSIRARLGLHERVVAAGHQAEFFHAGVFAKVLAGAALARQLGASHVFLVVDSDTPKQTALPLPEITRGGLRKVGIAVPGVDPKRVVAAQPAAPIGAWLDFFSRAGSMLEGFDRAALPAFAGGATRTSLPAAALGEVVTRGLEAVLAAMQISSPRLLAMTRLAVEPEFRGFARLLLEDPQRTATAYNSALARYQTAHYVRSPQRPLPPLTIHDGLVETPLWLMRPDGTRARLFIRGGSADGDLTADGTSLGPASAWWSGAALLGRVLPRALTLSAFARLVLSDVFIHGIGGAKYDEITEPCFSDVLQCRFPPLACVSATLHVPLPRHEVGQQAVRAAERRERDFQHNPDRHIDGVPPDWRRQRSNTIERIAMLRARRAPIAVRAAAHKELANWNARIAGLAPRIPEQLRAETERLRQAREEDAVALDREYFFALQPLRALRELGQQFEAAVAGE